MMSKYVRLGGLAAVLGGALLFGADVWGLSQELLGSSPDKFSEVVQTTSYTVTSAMFLIGGVLLLIGLVALYARQSEEAEVLGLVGFLAALAGTALAVGAFWTSAFVAPSVAMEAPAFLDGNPGGPLGLGFMLTFASIAVGWALFGVATFKARVFPRVAAAVLTVGAIVTFAPLPAATLLFDLALIWMGYSLFSKRREETHPVLKDALENAASPQPAVGKSLAR